MTLLRTAAAVVGMVAMVAAFQLYVRKLTVPIRMVGAENMAPLSPLSPPIPSANDMLVGFGTHVVPR